MTSFQIGLLVLACVFGGALAGMSLGRVLPAHHLGDDTKRVVDLTLGTLSVLSALVIGLLVSYAKDDIDAQTKGVQKFAADLVLLDRVMRQFGPETGEARDLLRRYTTLKIALTWPKENAGEGPRLDDPAALEMLESVQAKLRGLTPQSLPLEVEQPRVRRPACCSSLASMWVRFRQAAQVATITCQARRSLVSPSQPTRPRSLTDPEPGHGLDAHTATA